VIIILNHNKIPVWGWDGSSESRCPDCGANLTSRKGEYVVWHWAHYPNTSTRNCWTRESRWHLLMKKAYYDLKNWKIEVPFTVKRKKFRIDAANLETGSFREFVHTLSPNYIDKHRILADSGMDIMWIFDGNEFGRNRLKRVRGGGIKHLLKPRARDIHLATGGLVHFERSLWHEWKKDIWYPNNGPAAKLILNLFKDKRQEILKENREDK